MKLPKDIIKAYHILPNTETGYQIPTVICEFIYFDEKLEIFKKKKRVLRKVKNYINGKNIYLNKPLTEVQSQIKDEAVKRNMIVSTYDCAVSVLVDKAEKKPTYKKINEIDELNNVNAIKKNDKNPQPTNDNLEDYYLPAHREARHKIFLKMKKEKTV